MCGCARPTACSSPSSPFWTSSAERDGAVGPDRPVRVVRNLPWMAVGIDEDSRVAAPEGLRPCAWNVRAGRAGLLDDGVDLLRRAAVVGERDAAPAAGVLDAAVRRELFAAPERHDHAARLEEDDVVRGGGARLPAERLVERAGAGEVRNAKGDEAEALLHQAELCWRARYSRRSARVRTPTGRPRLATTTAGFPAERSAKTVSTEAPISTAGSGGSIAAAMSSESAFWSRKTRSRSPLSRIEPTTSASDTASSPFRTTGICEIP